MTSRSNIVARVIDADDKQMTVHADLVWDGKPRATATALWKRWRPRTTAPADTH